MLIKPLPMHCVRRRIRMHFGFVDWLRTFMWRHGMLGMAVAAAEGCLLFATLLLLGHLAFVHLLLGVHLKK